MADDLMADPSVFPYMQSEAERTMMYDLATEAIQIYGFDCYYVPRTLSATFDPILTEDTQAQFDLAIPTRVYLQTPEQFGGPGHFLNQQGWNIGDQIILVMARRLYEQDIFPNLPQTISALNIPQPDRPLEGDLIYVPFNRRLFVIRFVQKYSMLYPMGALPTWQLQCEVYEATSQQFNTGIPEIDAFEKTTTLDTFRWSIRTENGQPIMVNGTQFGGGDFWVVDGYSQATQEPEDQTVPVRAAANTILDFDENDVFGENSV